MEKNSLELLEAAAVGDLETVHRLLAEGADPHSADAEFDDEEVRRLRRVVHQIGDSAIGGRKLGRNALIHAAVGGHVAVVDRLLAAGVDLEATDVLGLTALSAAVEENQDAVVLRLLDAGADANTKSGFGVPVLTAALYAENLSIARELLRQGAAAHPKAKSEHQPLVTLVGVFPTRETVGGMITVFSSDEEKEKSEINVEEGLALVRELLAEGAGAESPHLLSQAVMTDLPELFEVLIEAGADPSVRVDAEDTLLGWAASCGAERMVEYFLERGADPNEGSGTILLGPISRGGVAMVRRLLEAGADPNREINDDGETPVMRAASRFFGNTEILRLLLQKGADPNRRNREGATALDIAEGEESREAAEILREIGAQYGEPVDEESREEENPWRNLRAEAAGEIPIRERRGLHWNDSGNSWETVAARAPAEMIVAALRSAGLASSARRAKYGEQIDAPPCDVLWLLRLKGHRWTQVLTMRRRKLNLAEVLSHELQDRALRAGHNDTANATFYTLYESGEVLEDFETTGEGFGDEAEEWEDEDWDDEDANLDLKLESTLRDPARVNLGDYEDEDAFLDEFLRSQDVYLALAGVNPHYEDRKLVRFYPFVWPQDVYVEEAIAEEWIVELRPRGVQKKWREPDDAMRKLFAAIDEKDLEGVEAALAAGADPNTIPSRRQRTALGSNGNHVEIARRLIAAGADPGDGGDQPMFSRLLGLVRITTADTLETMQLLLDAGVDPHAPGEYGRLPLHAFAGASVSAVKLLLLAGADPRRVDEQGRTARQAAERIGSMIGEERVREAIDLLRRAEEGENVVEETPQEIIEAQRRADAENPYPFGKLDQLFKQFTNSTDAKDTGDAEEDE